MEKTIITVVGHDTVGIIARICTYLAENGITDPTEAELYVGLMSAETMEDIVSGTGTFKIG